MTKCTENSDKKSENVDNDSKGSSTVFGEQKQQNEFNTFKQSKFNKRKKRQFEYIKQEKDFQTLLKKEKKIREE